MRGLLESESRGNYSGFLNGLIFECGGETSAFEDYSFSPKSNERLCLFRKSGSFAPALKKTSAKRGQFCSGFVDERDFLLQRFRGDADLLFGFFPALEFQGLTDAGNSFCFVARVLAGRVDFVLEPGTPREAFWIRQAALAFHQQMIQLLHRSGGC